MAKALSAVSVKMIDGTTYYVKLDEFKTFNVTEAPDSVIGQYIRGKRGPMLKAYTAADFSGAPIFLNPALIVSMTPTYA